MRIVRRFPPAEDDLVEIGLYIAEAERTNAQLPGTSLAVRLLALSGMRGDSGRIRLAPARPGQRAAPGAQSARAAASGQPPEPRLPHAAA